MAASAAPTVAPSAPAARTAPARRAVVADLHRFADVKAELVAGRIVELPMPGRRPSFVASLIAGALIRYGLSTGRGEGCADGRDFTVPELRSGRESFRPDASWHAGPFPDDSSDFIPAAPTFAVEVRSRSDYGPAAEAAMRDKRADYFEAGTSAVWDVDPAARTVRLFTSQSGPDTPSFAFHDGDTAHAEPALPGWRLATDEIFGPAGGRTAPERTNG